MTVSRMLAPWPRRLSAAVLMTEPNGLTPPGSVGCSVSVEPLQLRRGGRPTRPEPRCAPRDHRVVGHRRPAGVDGRQLDGAGGHQRRRQDRGVGVGRHLVLVVVPERDLDPIGLRLDLVDPADVHTEDADVVARRRCRCCSRSTPTTLVRLIGVAGPQQHDHAGDQQHDKADGDPAPADAIHRPASPPKAAAPHRARGPSTGLGVGMGMDPSPGGAAAGGPGGGPPGGGAGSGSR